MDIIGNTALPLRSNKTINEDFNIQLLKKCLATVSPLCIIKCIFLVCAIMLVGLTTGAKFDRKLSGTTKVHMGNPATLHAVRQRRQISGIMIPSQFTQEEKSNILERHRQYREDSGAGNMLLMVSRY